MRYTIQAYHTEGGTWYILGSETTDHAAKRRMEEYRVNFPHLRLRVVDNANPTVIATSEPDQQDDQ